MGQKPKLIMGGDTLEYIDTSSEDISEEELASEGILEEDSDDDLFHAEWAEADLLDMNSSTVSWRSAVGGAKSTHRDMTNQGFYILFQDKSSSIANLTGKYTGTALWYVYEGSVAPDKDETQNGSEHHYCTPTLLNKNKKDNPTAYTKFNDHFYNAGQYYSWGQYNNAYMSLGRSIHYMEDILSPPHAAIITGRAHEEYETWVRDEWRSDYYVTSAPSSTYSYMIAPTKFSEISSSFATASKTAASSCFSYNNSTVVKNAYSINATRDCVTRAQRAVAGLAYRYLIVTGRA